MSKEMLINVSEGEECRIALVENGRLEELYMERTSATSHVGNIYKGRVTNVEPSIQAAFVDFGLGRNGFLHISDLMPTYFGRDGSDYQETVGRKMARRDRPPIQRCLRRGDEIIVQIIKEGIGTKGPTLTSYISIPGRILVMMPGMGKMGVSKKIEDEEERRRLRKILDGLKPPKDVAFIIRTAGIGKTKTEIERDLKYLTRLWETIEKKQKEPGPVELYTEGDLVTRTVRDVFTSDVERIVVDSKDVARRVKDVIKITAPRTKNKVDVYEGTVPLFHEYGIEKDIELMYSRHVPLPSGGSLVIDSTEAIVAIDVNSGKNRESGDAETTAFRVDMEAADEICRQLKLRDLGGVVICDFIDLRYERHRRELEKRLDDNFRRDRAKTKVLRMSQFGIIELTRQRMRPSLKRSVYFDCPHCKGAGLVKTPESMALDVMRKVAIAATDQKVARVEVLVCPDVAFYLLNKKRKALTALEEDSGKKVLVRSDASLGLDEIKFALFDARDGAVVLEELGMTLPHVGHVSQLGRRGGRNDSGRNGGGRRDGRGDQQQNRRGNQPAARPQAAEEEDEDARFARETAEEAQERDEELPDVADTAGIAHPVDDEDEHEPDEDHDQHDDHDDVGETAEAEPQAAEEADERSDEEDPSAPSQRNGEGSGQNGEGHRRRRRRGRRGRGGGGERTANGEQQPSQPSQPPASNGTRQQGGPQRRDDKNVAAYDRGRRADGSFENVTELETVDFGDEDEIPQPVSNERPTQKDGRRGGGRSQEPRNRQGSGGRRDGRGGGQQQRPQRTPPKAIVSEDDETVIEGIHEPGDINGNLAPRQASGSGPREPRQPRESHPARPPQAREEGDEPAVDENGEPLAEGEQPRKRRRRRGGRRHRRRRENQLAREEGATPGLLPASPNDGGDSITPQDDDAGDEYGDEQDDVVEAEVTADIDADEVEENEAVDEGEQVKEAPAKTRRSASGRSSAARRASPPAAPLPVVKTGSTDKHLIVDSTDDAENAVQEAEILEITEIEAPVTPTRRRKSTSTRRPSSYADLDAIPDDYD